MSNKIKIGARLLQLRKQNGLTLENVSKIIDKQTSTISNWENDRAVPNANDLIKLSQLYGKSIDYILTGKEPEHPDVLKIQDIAESIVQTIQKKGYYQIDAEIKELSNIIKDMKNEQKSDFKRLIQIIIELLKFKTDDAKLEEMLLTLPPELQNRLLQLNIKLMQIRLR